MKTSNIGPTLRLLALTTVTAFVAVTSARAQIVSLNLIQNPGNNNQQIDGSETFGIASLSSVVGSWNNFNAGANNLIDSLGAATTVDFSVTQPNGQATFNNAYTNTPLFAGLDDYTTTPTPVSLTLSDLNATFASGYFAIVYVGGFNANTGASITDGVSTDFFRLDPTPVAPYGSFVRTTQTTDLGAGNNPIAQYAVFGSAGSPLTADTITFTIDTLSGGGAALGGVQIVAVPEPTSAGLLMSGAMLLVLCRRKRTQP